MDFFSCWNDGTEDKGHLLQWIMYYELVDSFTGKRIKLLQGSGMFFFPTFSWKEILKLLGSCSHLTHFYKEFAANELSMVWCQCWEVVEMVPSISNLWGVEIAWAAHAVCFQDLNLSVSIFVSWPLWPHLTFCLWISNMFCTLPWSTGLIDQGMFDHLACGLPAFLMESKSTVGQRCQEEKVLPFDFRLRRVVLISVSNTSGVKRKLYSNAFMFTGSWIF